MERHYGGEGIALAECINKRLGKWIVRWDVQPHINEETGERQGVSFVQKGYPRKPLLSEVVEDVLVSGIPMSLDEAEKLGTLLGEDPLEQMKRVLDIEITRHDTSSAVNSFTLDGVPMWLDKATRVGLMNSTNIEKASGSASTTLWFGGLSISLPCDTAIQMLSALELYALDCYNRTAEHRKNASELSSVAEVKAYDYTSGYPDKLAFSTSVQAEGGAA